MPISLEFLITSIVVILLPGTGVLYTVAIGLGRGFRPSLAAAFGCTLGILPAALASILGLAAVLHASALAFQIIKYLGVLYLFYMAWTILKHGSAMDVPADKRPASMIKIATSGMLINILNPKLSFFFMAFLPQFITTGSNSTLYQMIVMAAVFMVLTFVVFIGYGACASTARRYVVSNPPVMKWLKRSFAATFGFLGLRLALAER